MEMDQHAAGLSGTTCSSSTRTSNTGRRLARLYAVEEAQIMFDDLPSDLSEEETILMQRIQLMNLSQQSLQGPVLEEFKSCSRPVDFFLKFFDRTLEEDIVFQINLYAQQKQRVVTPITLQDLRGFIGINVVMKYHVLPSYTHYWSSEPDLGVEIVASTMTKSRFQAHLSNLHVNNEANATENDKLWKLRPLIDRLNLNFGKLWHKEKEKGQLFCE
ncbi:PiggyBac transposable element-derived protein 2-like [Plakobranchus ocellatus]|uniref:PiggyBac transposable element-derived protein 2-like n=1 Tax=Plakobranchus ocellatus TaxID=259542 RepID=A0AAV3ZM83_9GAST|nr:PiggyBac transposable element-derived protein 2-like [Plakobranchus ocellatus]